MDDVRCEVWGKGTKVVESVEVGVTRAGDLR
jgi:hypothetical protein